MQYSARVRSVDWQSCSQERARAGRLAYATLAALLLAGIATDAITHSSYCQVAVFGVGPDLALLYGGGRDLAQGHRDLAQGQLHPRAVPVYNLVHRFWGPLALAALVGLGLIPNLLLIGALTWLFHIALDRSLGYGLRTHDGYQRPRADHPRAREVVNAARELLEEAGIEALSMRPVAQQLGIRAPSIHKHLPDKETLQAAIAFHRL
jgi:hypothetical protein